jgi:rsbT co-antagonist protein RsbR
MGKAATRVRGQMALGFTPDDRQGLEDFWNVYDAHYDEISAEARAHLMDDPEFGPLMKSMTAEQTEAQSRESRERLRGAILHGEWEHYLAYLREQGAAYAQMGVSFSGWFRVLNVFRPSITKLLVETFSETPGRFRAAVDAMDKFLDGAMALIGEEYLNAKERIIREQQVAIRELSTPVLQIRDGLLLLPLVGVIDSSRARQMTDQLLHAIREYRAKVVVVDITGVPAVDSMVANHLVQVVEAARLLGARAILTGLSAEVAQTLVRIGVDLGKVQTTGNLLDGVREANKVLGYHVVKDER